MWDSSPCIRWVVVEAVHVHVIYHTFEHIGVFEVSRVMEAPLEEPNLFDMLVCIFPQHLHVAVLSLAHATWISVLGFCEHTIVVDSGFVQESPFIFDRLQAWSLVDMLQVVLPGSLFPSQLTLLMPLKRFIIGRLGVKRGANIADMVLIPFRVL